MGMITMPEEDNKNTTYQQSETCHKRHSHKANAGAGGAVYGLGFTGALVYYFMTATTFAMGAIGFLKAIVWPAFLVYELMKYLSM